MAVVKNKPERFLLIDAQLVADETVSNTAKLLYIYAVNNKSSWCFYRQNLLDKLQCRKTNLLKAIEELRQLGYVTGYFQDPGHSHENTLTFYVAPIGSDASSTSADSAITAKEDKQEDDWL